MTPDQANGPTNFSPTGLVSAKIGNAAALGPHFRFDGYLVGGGQLPTAATKLLKLPPRQLQWLIATFAIAGFASVSTLSIIFSESAALILFLPLVSLACVVAGWIVVRAIAGSPSAIMTYLALVTFVTDAEFRLRDAGETTVDWQSLLKFVVWAGAGIIGVFHMPPLRTFLHRSPQFLWTAYLAIALASSVYAFAPVYSFGCAFSLLCLFAFAFALIRNLSEAQFLWTIVISFALFLVAGWGVYFENPALGISEFWTYNGMELRMSGLAGQATDLGSICAKYLGAIFLLWISGRCRLGTAAALASIGVISLVASDARTGMIAIVAAVVIAILVRSQKGTLCAALLIVTGIVSSVIFSFPTHDFGSHFSRSGDPTEVFTLTGRLEIWKFVWDKIQAAPFFGWGYNASKILLPQHEFLDGLLIDTAHNALLQNLLSVGFIGTLPIIAILFYFTFRMISSPYAFRDVFFIIIFISGLTDTRAIGSTPTVMTLIFFVISIAPTRSGMLRPSSVSGMISPNHNR